MDVTTELKKHIHDLIDIARLAPSVHNSQPWRSVPRATLFISLSTSSMLYRQVIRQDARHAAVWVSSLKLCSWPPRARGLAHRQSDLHDNTVSIKFGIAPVVSNEPDIAALRSRCTDRSIYVPTTISEDMDKAITRSAQLPGVTVRVMTDRPLINQIAGLTSQGIGLALANPEFRQELSAYLALPWSSKDRGIATESLRIPRLLSYIEPTFMKLGLGIKKELVVERQTLGVGKRPCIITTKGDLYKMVYGSRA